MGGSANMGIQFGVFVPQGWRMDLQEIADPIEQYEAMTRVARAVDRLPAYDSIWVYDHFHPVPTPVPETVFECWTITAALARDTERVRIGQMVTGTQRSLPKWLPQSMSSPMVDSIAAWEPAGTSMSGAPMATAIPRHVIVWERFAKLA
jgi:Luciferase-like monooxygenase